MIKSNPKNMYRQLPLYFNLKLTFVFLVLLLLTFPGSLKSQTKGISWKNPLLIAGSDFGRAFQGYYLTGNSSMLHTLTSQESKALFGDSTIMNYYRKMQFAYSIKLITHKKVDNYYLLTYKATFLATTHIIVMKVVIEQDTARLILPNEFQEQNYFLLK